QSMSDMDRRKAEKSMLHHLTDSTLWNKAGTIGITISRGMEWNTRPIIERAWASGKTVCVPKCNAVEKKLDFYTFHSDDELEVVYYNLQEPKPAASKHVEKSFLDILIVPGLVFDQQGYRIGFGGGY